MDTDQRDALIEKGWEQIDDNPFSEPLSHFEMVLASEPTSLGALNGKAHALIYAKRYEEAVGIFDILLESHPDEAEIWRQRGACYYRLERYAEALHCFDRALSVDGGSIASLLRKGVELLNLGHLKEAIEYLDSIFEQFLSHPWVCQKKVFTLSVIDDNACAAECLQKALELDWRELVFWEQLGSSFDRVGLMAATMEVFSKAVKQAPDDPGTWCSKAAYCEAIGLLPEAIENHQKALELDPGYDGSLEGLASCLSSTGRPEQGLVYINRLLEKNPVDVITIFHRDILLEEIEKKRAEDDAPF